MLNLKAVLLILALLCFLLNAISIAPPRGNLIGAGLFLLTFALLVT